MAAARPSRADVALAAVLAVAALAENALGLVDGPAGPAAVALSPLVAVPLAWRRSRPQHVAAACFAAGLLQAAVAPVSVAGAALPLALVVATYSVAARTPLRRALVAGALVLVATTCLVLLDPEPDAGDVVYACSLMVVGWLFGRGAHLRSEHAQLLAERARWLEAERERAVLAERAGIARELHDVVAHRITGIVVQAAAGAREPGPGRARLSALEHEARQALTELRQLLGVLRHGGEPTALAPPPRLADLPALLDAQRARGLDARLVVEGEPGELAAGAEIAAYRVVQEALTNARRHGGPCHVDVRLRWRDDALEVAVTDDGTAQADGSGARLGLVGMRERLELHGGQLVAGPRPDGGFAVTAELPR